MNYFFVTGLPRSRTAWLANFLTTDSSFCYHDGIQYGELSSIFNALNTEPDLIKQSDPEITQKFFVTPVSNIGDSDTGLFSVADQLQQFDNASFVYINRDPEESYKSLLEYSKLPEKIVSEVFKTSYKGLKKLKKVYPGLEVEYAKLSEEDTLRAIWKHCRIDSAFSPFRVMLLQELNIQESDAKFEQLRQQIVL